jgi:hypothetical protein
MWGEDERKRNKIERPNQQVFFSLTTGLLKHFARLLVGSSSPHNIFHRLFLIPTELQNFCSLHFTNRMVTPYWLTSCSFLHKHPSPTQ